MSTTTALSDRALTKLCTITEQSNPRVAPDAIWLSGEPEVYEYLREIEALSLSNELALNIACRHCGIESYRPALNPEPLQAEYPYRGYCVECGWIDLRSTEARLWCVQPLKVARWLTSALCLTPQYVATPLIDGVLWRLGETEHRRKRRVMFFGRRLGSQPAEIHRCISQHAAPGASVILTTSDPADLAGSPLSAYLMVPLRAVAHLRKAGLVIENLPAYFDQPGEYGDANETSLRLLHSQRVALIDGEPHKLSPQTYQFLVLLDAAVGKALHKRIITDKLEIPVDTFKPGTIFKRHRKVYETFVDSDHEGRYWIKPEFVLVQKGR
jgi:hypothetical protein